MPGTGFPQQGKALLGPSGIPTSAKSSEQRGKSQGWCAGGGGGWGQSSIRVTLGPAHAQVALSSWPDYPSCTLRRALVWPSTSSGCWELSGGSGQNRELGQTSKREQGSMPGTAEGTAGARHTVGPVAWWGLGKAAQGWAGGHVGQVESLKPLPPNPTASRSSSGCA